ncbi:hypothetical protein [Eilatimonas milleporae]|uniref:DUF1499 domain-containing protein n=1 Tax=Eilatimonas milleporae TaxID=911205 RepID=A0A3M0C1B6_9PROT|nr:hypothetical protein [Eilatimonas milleporae]RMB02665.1 hypothetical protein BXY39_3015 [Eilatimonas milleporae]
MLDKFRTYAIGLSAIVFIAGIAFYAYVSMGGGGGLFGERGAALTDVDFATLDYTGDDPAYLLCPADLCGTAVPDADAPVFNVPAQTLRRAVADFTDNMPTINTLRFDLARNQFDFTERLPGQSFPAAITVRILEGGRIASGLPRSRLVIYSRQPVGQSSKQDHRDRVERWLRLIEARLTG